MGSPAVWPQPLGHSGPEVHPAPVGLPLWPDRWQEHLADLQQLIRQDGLLACARTRKPCRNGVSRAIARTAVASARTPRPRRRSSTEVAGLSRIWINVFQFPRQGTPRAYTSWTWSSYASRLEGGGRCCKAWSENCVGGVDSPTLVPLRNSMGGARDLVEDSMNPLALTLPSVNGPQSLPQDLLESERPTG